MWKSLQPGDRVSLGDIVRNSASHSQSALGESDYEVVKADLYHFEVVPKTERGNGREPERKIIKYIEIGYHFLVEIWLDHIANPGSSFHTSSE